MTDFSHLYNIAYKAERAASRKLARDSGIGEEAALHATLEHAAGNGGLALLLAERIALRAAAQARAAQRAAQKASANAIRAARHDGPATPWRAWFDGSAHPNPGRCGIGGLLLGPDAQQIEISQAAGYGNSSEAEYRALIAVLESAVRHGARGLTVYGDSQVVIDDLQGSDDEAALSLVDLRAHALGLMTRIDGVTVRWVPRHKNGAADALSQLAARPLADQKTARSTLNKNGSSR